MTCLVKTHPENIMNIEVKNIVKEYKIRKNPDTVGGLLTSIIKPKYEIFPAVNDISFTIKKGEAVGYVGPNGSGKSTTIKMLCGVLTPTKGQILMDGMPIRKNRRTLNKKMGTVFGNRSMLWWDIPVIDSYRALQTLYEIPDDVFKKNLSEFVEVLEMKKLLDIPERQLSLGQKMKCNIAAAFLHNPEIVFLDEPTIGLDSESKLKIREFIHHINKNKHTTFLITSHDFQDIEALCQRIILINHGGIIMDDEINKVKRQFQSKRQIVFDLSSNPWSDGKSLPFPDIHIKTNTNTCLALEYNANVVHSFDIINYVNGLTEVYDISINGQDIESIIRDIIKNDNQKVEKDY